MVKTKNLHLKNSKKFKINGTKFYSSQPQNVASTKVKHILSHIQEILNLENF